MQLEAYGVVREGQGGPFYADGGAGPDGPMPTNTGGGQLSAYYTTGFTGIAEAILQLRGQAGAGQPKRARTAPVSGDRKSVVEGKSVLVRVDLGGGRVIKTNTIQIKTKKR